VLATTVVFNASVASPVIAMIDLARSTFALDFGLLAAMIFGLEFPGAGPVRENDFLSLPDCMFHILISPSDEPARPKFPHAVTQTA
jgi:hypothetical protein